MIKLITKKDGQVVLNKTAKEGMSLDDVCWIAECEVLDGYADYACVMVDEAVYMELEN